MSSGTTDCELDKQHAANAQGTGVDEAWQLCTICWQRLPAHCFRRRSKATTLRHTECDLCHNKGRRALSAKRRAARIGVFATYVNENKGELRRIGAAFGEITRIFGGIQQFVAYWKEVIDNARVDRKHHLVARHLQAIANIGIASAQASIEHPSTESLSDEELNRSIDENVKAMIAQNPGIAIRAAKQLGWQVIPPEQEEGESEVDDLKAEAVGADDV